jgi:hypothetical protein
MNGGQIQYQHVISNDVQGLDTFDELCQGWHRSLEAPGGKANGATIYAQNFL